MLMRILSRNVQLVAVMSVLDRADPPALAREMFHQLDN